MNLPGVVSKLTSEESEVCEYQDCKQNAAWKIQGETDSMGCEYNHYCEEHFAKIRNEPVSDELETCDGCGQMSFLKPTRDWEEGNNGPVYYWCANCREQNAESFRNSFTDDELEMADRELFGGEDDDDFVDEEDEVFNAKEVEVGRFVAGNFFTRQELFNLDHFLKNYYRFQLTEIGICDLQLAIDTVPRKTLTFHGYVNTLAMAGLLDNLSGKLVIRPYLPTGASGYYDFYDKIEAFQLVVDKLTRYGYKVTHIALSDD